MALNSAPNSSFTIPTNSEDNHLLDHWINNIYGYGRNNGWSDDDDDDSYDPIDLLPADPFGMDSDTFSAVLAGMFEDCELGDQELFVGWDYVWNSSSGDSSGFQLNSDDEFDGWEEVSFSEFCEDESPEEEFLSNLDVAEAFNSSRVEVSDFVGEERSPHQGLLFALGYLGVQDLLSAEMVCRSLRSAVQDDPLLWRCIHIDSQLSERITDVTLLQLTQRAQGNLQCLSLVGCSRITDDGLRCVLESNPRLTKLSIPGCLKLNVEALINNLKALKLSGVLGLKHLELGRLFKITNKHYEELRTLLGADQLQHSAVCKPRYYHSGHSFLSCDDGRAIDIEICPMCQKLKLVYDCPAQSCQEKGPEQCRACEACIFRCVHCGSCIKNNMYVETFCLEYLCSACWKQPI